MMLVRMDRWHRFLTYALMLTGSLLISTAHAEWVLSLYGGFAHTPDTDFDFTEPGGTELTFEDVSWRDESFTDPPYFGVRLTYWIDRTPNWGLAVDFTHAKMVADLDQSVHVTGTRNGMPVDTVEPLRNTFSDFELSHGHNLLTANLLYRWFLQPRWSPSLLGRLQPYVGAGAGVALPHVDVNTANAITDSFQVGGFAMQGLVGLNIDVVKWLALFVETKLSYADIDGDLTDGGSISVQPWTYHVAFGFSLNY
ncbi:MAG: hypothetical protein OEU26_15855 [Candidatus Tectomicrobia bacterium]|nr:hypothetical protein [Candidatus Tectomicrobia bacterium]